MPLKRKPGSSSKKGHTYFSLCSKLPPNDSSCKFHESKCQQSATLHSTKIQGKTSHHNNRDIKQQGNLPSTSKVSEHPTTNSCEHFNNKTYGKPSKSTTCKLHNKDTSHGINADGMNISNDSENEIKSKNVKFHTDCKYCKNNGNSIKGKTAKKSIPHTDCKYCQNNVQIKSSKRVIPHKDCKYCLNNITSAEDERKSPADDDTMHSISSDAAFSDQLSELDLVDDCTCFPCSLHDSHFIAEDTLPHVYVPQSPYHHHLRHMKPASYKTNANTCNICENPSFCLVNEEFADTYANIIREQISCSHTIQENNCSSIKSRSYCEYCLRNGQSAVIYNSHQFRNTFGIVTCPILRHYVCPGCEQIHGFEPEEMMSALNGAHVQNSVPYASFCTTNGCGSHNMPVNGTYSDESLEMPYYHHSLKNNRWSQSNPVYCCNFDDDLFKEKFYNASAANCIPNKHRKPPDLYKYDTQNFFSVANNPNIYQTHQSNSNSNYKFPTEHVRRHKKNISCQFCLTNGEPPLIYNSHQLRDETGTGLKCPILKQQVNGAAHACNGCVNYPPETVPHFPFVKGISNGLLNKRQYLDLVDCLV